MRNSTRITVFLISLAVLFLGLGWISTTLIRLDASESEARMQAILEETIRLALWRMDSSMATIIAGENARPYFEYLAFYPADQVYTRMFSTVNPGDILIPSPLLTEPVKYIKLHFQIDPDGTLSSPQVPAGNMRDLAELHYLSSEMIFRTENILNELKPCLDRDRLELELEKESLNPILSKPVALMEQKDIQQQNEMMQQTRNIYEFKARSSVSNQQVDVVRDENQPVMSENRKPSGVMKALWVDDCILLARKVDVDGNAYLQGCCLDWPEIRNWMLDSIQDLMTGATLVPASDSNPGESRMLASLPVRLVPGDIRQTQPDPVSSIRIALTVVWFFFLLAAGSLALLVWGTMVLTERRAAFVSAVTHELRTPLTTLKMYSEMLAENVVTDPERRTEYFGTLRSEAERLGNLIENVLAYSRLEKNRAPFRIESYSLNDIVNGIEHRLRQRCAQAGMQLKIDMEPEYAGMCARTDISAVEQIVFNLIDNSCKYASNSNEKEILLCVLGTQDLIRIQICDRGPGLSPAAEKKLFKAFSKSAREAADTAPGVGLGLALGKRIARELGGDLNYIKRRTFGAVFELVLPRCS